MSGTEITPGAQRLPGRREFFRTVGAASLGLAAAGPALSSLSAAVPSAASSARLDPSAPLRIGMIGNVGHTYTVFNALGKIPGAIIAAYSFEDGDWEYNSDGTKRGGQKYDLEEKRRWCRGQKWSHEKLNVYETYQEMLDREKLDVAVVCLPYARNAWASAAAAERGIHVMCEKPVAVNFEDLEMLDAAVKKSGVRLSAMFAMRFSPSIYTIKKQVESGAVGAVAMARAQKSYKWGESRPWFYRHSEIYGSTILWVAIHAIDYIRWTTGLEVTAVSGMHGNAAHPDYPGCQDHAVVNMMLAGGATAAVTADYLRPESAPTHGDDRLRVIGPRGVIETKEAGARVELIAEGRPAADLPNVEPPDMFADFAAELRGQGQHLIGPDEAVRVTRICIAATRAAEQGSVIAV